MRANRKFGLRYCWGLVSLLLALVACQSAATNRDSHQDAAAAQRHLLHDIPGYSELDTLDALFAIDQFIAGASLLSGNFLVAGLIERLGALGECYQNVGALAARAYTNVAAGKYGLLLVVNQERVLSNFLACATRGPIFAQNAGSACLQAGQFAVQPHHYWYVYAGTHPDLCAALGEHFGALRN